MSRAAERRLSQHCGDNVPECFNKPFCIHMQQEAIRIASEIQKMVRDNQNPDYTWSPLGHIAVDGRDEILENEYHFRTNDIVRELNDLADILEVRVYG